MTIKSRNDITVPSDLIREIRVPDATKGQNLNQNEQCPPRNHYWDRHKIAGYRRVDGAVHLIIINVINEDVIAEIGCPLGSEEARYLKNVLNYRLTFSNNTEEHLEMARQIKEILFKDFAHLHNLPQPPDGVPLRVITPYRATFGGFSREYTGFIVEFGFDTSERDF